MLKVLKDKKVDKTSWVETCKKVKEPLVDFDNHSKENLISLLTLSQTMQPMILLFVVMLDNIRFGWDNPLRLQITKGYCSPVVMVQWDLHFLLL